MGNISRTLEHLKSTRSDDMSNWEVSVLEHEHLLGIVFTGRTRHFSQLLQPK